MRPACLAIATCSPNSPLPLPLPPQGLQRQAEELLAAARCECNLRRWQPPLVVIFFPSGVDQEVQARLGSMGIYVAAGPGVGGKGMMGALLLIGWNQPVLAA